jgi:hypothetical protein
MNKSILIAFIFSASCFAALPATAVWEVEIGASDSNAGCRNSVGTGTDYSLQASPQFSFTDLVIAATTTNVTSASHPFVVADVGNCIFISAGTGFTAGRYVISSVTAGVATLDRSAGTAASTGGTWVEGGALLTPGQADSLVVASNIIFLQYNATPFGITTSSAGAGGPLAAATLKVVQSYATTRTVNNADANRATIQTQAGTITSVTGAGSIIIGVIFDGNSQTTAKFISASATLYKVTAKGFNAASTGTPIWVDGWVTANSAVTLVGICDTCEVSLNTATAAAPTFCRDCIGHDNSGATTDGFAPTVSSVFMNCSAYNNGRDGINSVSAANVLIINCDSETNGRYGYGFTAGAGPRVIDNYAGFGNTTSLTNNAVGTISTSNLLSLSGSAYTTPGSGNFALNNTSGAGAVLRNAALPTVFPAGTTATYMDVGAARHQDPAGGSVTLGYPIQ